jgi:thioredoxin-related protein
MKKIFLSLAVVLSFVTAEAQKVEFFRGNWYEANEQAKKENRFIFVDAYTQWCGWCKVMDEKMFTDAEVATFINNNFIPVKIDFEDSIGVLLSMKFRVWAYPTTLVFNAQGQLVDKFSGYTENYTDYLNFLKNALAVKEDKVFDFNSKDLNLKYPEFYTASFLKGKERKWPADSILTDYLVKQEDLFSEINWSVLLRFHPEKYEDYVLINRDEYTKRYGADETYDFIYTAVYNYVQKAIDSADQKYLEIGMKMCGKLKNPEEARLGVKFYYYEETKDWEGYAETLGKFIELKGFTDHMTINNSCWTIYEKADNQEVVMKAVNWMKTVIEDHPIWMYLDTYAALLFKSGNLEEALKYADLAIETGKQEGQKDISSTKELREKIKEAMKKQN